MDLLIIFKFNSVYWHSICVIIYLLGQFIWDKLINSERYCIWHCHLNHWLYICCFPINFMLYFYKSPRNYTTRRPTYTNFCLFSQMVIIMRSLRNIELVLIVSAYEPKTDKMYLTAFLSKIEKIRNFRHNFLKMFC